MPGSTFSGGAMSRLLPFLLLVVVGCDPSIEAAGGGGSGGDEWAGGGGSGGGGAGGSGGAEPDCDYDASGCPADFEKRPAEERVAGECVGCLPVTCEGVLFNAEEPTVWVEDANPRDEGKDGCNYVRVTGSYVVLEPRCPTPPGTLETHYRKVTGGPDQCEVVCTASCPP